MHFTSQTVLVVIVALALSTSADTLASTVVYAGNDCSGTPLVVSVVESVDCEVLECSVFAWDKTAYSTSTTCVNTDRESYVSDAFAGLSYVLIETYTKTCKRFMGASAYLATGECQPYDGTSDNSVIATVNEDGSASLGIFNDTTCSGTPFLGYSPESEMVSNHSCYRNYNVIYVGTDSSTSVDSSTITTSSQTVTSSSSGAGSVASGDDVGSSMNQSNCHEVGSADGSATVSITPSESSGGINTGVIVGIVVAYIMLCVAACILCFDRLERFVRRLGLRRY